MLVKFTTSGVTWLVTETAMNFIGKVHRYSSQNPVKFLQKV